MAPAPVKIDQQISRELLLALNQNNPEECECEIIHQIDWKLSNDTVLCPDIVMVSGDDSEKYLTKAPKIIIEIISPSTAKKDETIKFDIYEDEKVNYYILVYPSDLRAKGYKLKDNKYTKVGDFTNEKLVFEDIGCGVEIDFKKVFKRFR